MKVQILCTLGPSSLRPDVIARLDERGVDLFRINLASVVLDAGISNDRFYTMLVLLALITSVIAGTWLEAVLKRGQDLLEDASGDRLAGQRS